MTQALDILCQSCGASLRVEAHLRTAQCPYCDSPSVVERPPSPGRPDPTFALGFQVEHARAVKVVEGWLRTRGPFAHRGLAAATLEKTRGVYLPAYLYGAVADSRYSSEIGESYTEVETYTTRDAKGQSVTRTRSVVRTEWRTLAGERSSYLIDVLVTASRGIPNAELEDVEPFDLRALVRYDPALLSGWVAEEPSLSLDECLSQAHAEALARVGRELAAFLPGDSQRGLRHETRLSHEVIDIVLLPLWVFAARYAPGRPPVRVLVNGQTGEVQGRVPLAWPRIAVAIAVAVGLVVALAVLVAGRG